MQINETVSQAELEDFDDESRPQAIALSRPKLDEPEPDDDGLFEHTRLVIEKKQTLVRIDKFLLDRLAHVTRNRIQNAIEEGLITVNGQDVKASYKVKPDDVISVRMPHPPRDTEVHPEDIPLNIVYEDAALLMVDKVAGMVVHPAQGNWEGTLVNALVFHLQNLPTHRNGEIRPGLVHRIDKDTSGLLVIAKTEDAMTKLAHQFFMHTTERSYMALVWGDVKEDEGTIDQFLARSMKDRRITTVVDDETIGRRAITHYKVLERFHYVTLIECRLETGRTHQIRAHMRFLGHPLFSDATYGGDKILKGTTFQRYRQFVENCFKLIPRQALHARSLGFVHPETGERMYFESPLPEDFKAVLEKWRNYTSQMDKDNS